MVACACGQWKILHLGPSVIADVALEECLKAVHKRTDADHIFLIPRLYSPFWLRLFYKLSDFVFHISPGLHYWPASMHKPLFIGISLPLLSRSPWTLRRTSLLVGMELELRRLPDCSEANGRSILRKLLRVPRRVAAMLDDLAKKLLCLPGTGEVPGEGNQG